MNKTIFAAIKIRSNLDLISSATDATTDEYVCKHAVINAIEIIQYLIYSSVLLAALSSVGMSAQAVVVINHGRSPFHIYFSSNWACKMNGRSFFLSEDAKSGPYIMRPMSAT